jgi:tetratricopeptide (TPR) repeat protein
VLTALDEVEQAVELDPEFKEAWALVAGIRCGYAVFVDPVNTEEHRRRGEQAAKRALQLDPEFGAGHAALALALAVRKDWTGAEEAFRTAKNLNVPLGELGSYAFLHLSAGKFGPLARDIFEAERAAEPSNALFYRFLMFVHAGLGEWATANEFYESGLRLFPGSAEASRIQNQRMHWLIGRNDVGEARKIVIDDPFNAAMVRTLDMPREQALAALRREYEASAAGNPNHRRDIGLWAGHFGDPAFALEAMRAAIDEQSAQMVFVWLPQLASMRRLPEFKAYMREVGMVAYWQEFGWPPFCHKVDATDFECD